MRDKNILFSLKMTTIGQTAPLLKLNLSDIIEDIFMVLSDKEKEVVVRRFSLDNKEKQTLESIGRSFNVTRERVRQIEKIALSKLRRTVSSTKLRYIHELAEAILKENGFVLLEENLVEKILATIEKTMGADQFIVRLALTICPAIQSIERNNLYRLAWFTQPLSEDMLEDALDYAVKALKEKKDVMSVQQLIPAMNKVPGFVELALPESFYASLLEIDFRIKSTETGFGLMTWRHINPKSIRDKAIIVLKHENKPLHFVDIAQKISDSQFDHKKVTIQAVHNELIRYEQFVLVGRGLYALKDWGYEEGTVTDIIENLLKKQSPLTKQEILKGVLKQRNVKKGTISLNLQKNPQFVRVGRAVYDLDLSKKK